MKTVKNNNIQKFDMTDDLHNRYSVLFEKTGEQSITVSILGDAGNYTYSWRSTGMEPFSFIASLDFHYFWKKMMFENDSPYISSGFDLDISKTIESLLSAMTEAGKEHLEAYPGDKYEISCEMNTIKDALSGIRSEWDIVEFEKLIDEECPLLSDFFTDGVEAEIRENPNSKKDELLKEIKKLSAMLSIDNRFSISYSFKSSNAVGLNEYYVHISPLNQKEKNEAVIFGVLDGEMLLSSNDRDVLSELNIDKNAFFDYMESELSKAKKSPSIETLLEEDNTEIHTQNKLG